MAIVDNPEQDPALVTHACQLSLDEHIEVAMSGLTMVGAGIGCETEYKALLVIAETSKILHGHGDFDPRPRAQELAAQTRAIVDRILQAQHLADAMITKQPEVETMFPAPDNGIVH